MGIFQDTYMVLCNLTNHVTEYGIHRKLIKNRDLVRVMFY